MEKLAIWLYNKVNRAAMQWRDLLQQVRIVMMPLPAPAVCHRVRPSARHLGTPMADDIRPNGRDIVPWI